MLSKTRALILTMALLVAADASAQTPPPRPDFAAAPGWAYVSGSKCWAHFPDGKKLEVLLATWTGKCTDQKISGAGTLAVLTDLVVTGTFENGELKGPGKISWAADMVTYDGTFSDGAFRGTGKAAYSDGSRYQGGFIDTKFDGQGRWDVSSTTYYEGTFKNGVMYGQGKLTFAQGTIEGQFNGWAPYTEATFTQAGKEPVSGILTPPANLAEAAIVAPAWPPTLRQNLVLTAHFMVNADGSVTDVHTYGSVPGKTGLPETMRQELEKSVQAARFTPAKIGDTIVPMPWEFIAAYER